METIAADAPAPGAGPDEARSDAPVDDTIALIRATIDESLRLAGSAWALLRAELRLARSSAFVLIWLAAAWLRRRVGETGYWQLLGLVAMIWVGAILVTRMMLR